jgi:hypothetical protein
MRFWHLGRDLQGFVSLYDEAMVSFCERCDFGRAYKPIIRSTILPAIRLEEGFSIMVNVVEFPHVAPFEKSKEISHTESSPHLGCCSFLFQYWWYLKKLWHVTPCKFHLIVQ